MSFSILELQAMKLVPDLPGWVPWKFRAIHGGVLCEGAVCPLITRGRRKGQPNYRKGDPSTRREVFVAATSAKDSEK